MRGRWVGLSYDGPIQTGWSAIARTEQEAQDLLRTLSDDDKVSDASDLCEVIITAPDGEWLAAFTRSLIKQRLASAGHHQPIRSVYTWQGTIHDTTETRLALHTRTALVDRIIEQTNSRHPLRCPASLPSP